ncbi:hypothetical protein [Capnocytophaga felis]|uniref:Transglutaminase-like domain-containing protein n=1 Tax=Capnocytophaga felis TaxID=2267611 RepID=A0A5M4BCC9_9FLAO|nr:hypothetical protein [Capnocytophaga felis]GET46917.1 hypothetical protein RCZ01_22190 [Capnocytophaga felis]GET49437.1 hypothetical protein RCZ02_22680 [Capnocytophaga felis]
MSNAESINKSLYRPLLSGIRYDAYMPFSDCSSVKLGEGDTSFSIAKMKEWALKYRHHTERLTKRFFSSLKLNDLCKEVHSFLFNHIQYKLDGTNQMLRSPACAWLTRNEGIDCKSYSIFASTILQNAGISHYMRRIKQEGMYPDAFTHVYIVVPKNQKTNDLSEGYYTIDGTIRQFGELPFLAKDDVFIPKAKGLGIPENTKNIKTQSTGKHGAWQSFVSAIDVFEGLMPDNLDLLRLKRKVHWLAKQQRTDVHFFIDGFTILLDGERYDLIKIPQGMSAPTLDIDALIADSYNEASHYTDLSRQQGKQKAFNNVNVVGNAAASVAALFPGAGQIVGICIAAVTALVSLAVMFGYDPCAGAFYTSDYINNNLQSDFHKKFKATMERVQKNIDGSTQPLAVNDLNTLLKEIDLGFKHFQHELNTHFENECSRNALQGYQNFAVNVKQSVDAMLEGLKVALGEDFNVSIIERESSTSSRMWYFIVPAAKNTIKATYRVLSIESRDKKKGVYPYGTEESFDNWLNNNVAVLSGKYGTQVGQKYKAEMLPFKEKIAAIRRNIFLPVLTRVSAEDKLRKEQYEIWLKYDEEYKNEMLRASKNKLEAYAKTQVSFWEEMKKIRAQRLSDEKRRLENVQTIERKKAQVEAGILNKKNMSLRILALLGGAIIWKLKQ